MVNSHDEAIVGQVTAALAESPDVHSTEIRVHAASRWVRLTGVVATLKERHVAEEIARRVPGVVGVENDLSISSDKSITDQQIEQIISDCYAAAGLSEVGVKVDAGTAVLMGIVPTLAKKKLAVDVARSIKGVREVISQLEIAAGEPIDDLGLADDVAEALSDDPRIDLIDLRVWAKDGHVHIDGDVPAGWQRGLATTVAENVPGVKGVENHLTIGGNPVW